MALEETAAVTFGSERDEHPIAHLLVLLSVVCLALVTWAQLSEVMPGWKPVISVASTVVLALGALTRCARRAALLRVLVGMWMIAEPVLFGFWQIAPVTWSYMATGVLVAAISLGRSLRVLREAGRSETFAH